MLASCARGAGCLPSSVVARPLAHSAFVFVSLACHYNVRPHPPDQRPPASKLEQRSPGRWQGPSRACRDPWHGGRRRSPVASRSGKACMSGCRGSATRSTPRHKRSCLATSMPASQWSRATNCGRCNWPTHKADAQVWDACHRARKDRRKHKDLIANAERSPSKAREGGGRGGGRGGRSRRRAGQSDRGADGGGEGGRGGGRQSWDGREAE